MSNALTWNPLVVDTASATTPIVTGVVYVTKFRWVDYNNDIADGDQCIVQDKNGKPVWEDRNTTVGAGTTTEPRSETDFGSQPLRCNGLLVTTLTHGKLYIYLDRLQTGIPVT